MVQHVRIKSLEAYIQSDDVSASYPRNASGENKGNQTLIMDIDHSTLVPPIDHGAATQIMDISSEDIQDPSQNKDETVSVDPINLNDANWGDVQTRSGGEYGVHPFSSQFIARDNRFNTLYIVDYHVAATLSDDYKEVFGVELSNEELALKTRSAVELDDNICFPFDGPEGVLHNIYYVAFEEVDKIAERAGVDLSVLESSYKERVDSTESPNETVAVECVKLDKLATLLRLTKSQQIVQPTKNTRSSILSLLGVALLSAAATGGAGYYWVKNEQQRLQQEKQTLQNKLTKSDEEMQHQKDMKDSFQGSLKIKSESLGLSQQIVEEQEGTIELLKKKNEESGKSIEKKDDEIGKLNVEIKGLQANLSEKSQNVRDLKSEKDDLSTQKDQLEQAKTELSSQITELKAQIENLSKDETGDDFLQEDDTDDSLLTESDDELIKKIQEKTAEIERLEEKINKNSRKMSKKDKEIAKMRDKIQENSEIIGENDKKITDLVNKLVTAGIYDRDTGKLDEKKMESLRDYVEILEALTSRGWSWSPDTNVLTPPAVVVGAPKPAVKAGEAPKVEKKPEAAPTPTPTPVTGEKTTLDSTKALQADILAKYKTNNLFKDICGTLEKKSYDGMSEKELKTANASLKSLSKALVELSKVNLEGISNDTKPSNYDVIRAYAKGIIAGFTGKTEDDLNMARRGYFESQGLANAAYYTPHQFRAAYYSIVKTWLKELM